MHKQFSLPKFSSISTLSILAYSVVILSLFDWDKIRFLGCYYMQSILNGLENIAPFGQLVCQVWN